MCLHIPLRLMGPDAQGADCEHGAPRRPRGGMAKAAKAFAKESGQSSSELNKSSDDIVEVYRSFCNSRCASASSAAGPKLRPA